jgi:LacI family transcriptional regulator
MTIKEIAKLANTSRGTIDRVINKRGKVNKEVEARVRRVIQETGYIPNENGKILSLSNKKIPISVVIGSENNIFFNFILEGIKKAIATTYRYLGFDLEVFPVRLFDDQEILAALNAVSHKTRLLIVSTSSNQQIIDKIDSLKVPVIAVSLNIECRNKVGFVGCDFSNSGALAADLANLMAKEGETVGLLLGSYSHPGHSERLAGFRANVRSGLKLLKPLETFDDDKIAYGKVKSLLTKEKPDIIVFFGGGMIGGLKAISEASYHPQVITVDEIPEVIAGLKTGLVQASVSQHPIKQGRKCMDVAYDCLIKKETGPEMKRVNCTVILKDSALETAKGEN